MFTRDREEHRSDVNVKWHELPTQHLLAPNTTSKPILHLKYKTNSNQDEHRSEDEPFIKSIEVYDVTPTKFCPMQV